MCFPVLLISIIMTTALKVFDSGSDYGSRSHKKKKFRPFLDGVRILSRGIKVHDVQEFEENVEDQNGYYVDPNVQYHQEDEIEAVLGHSRDEGREDE
jgi:chromodomain-helicase-DNA-binding protein 1